VRAVGTLRLLVGTLFFAAGLRRTAFFFADFFRVIFDVRAFFAAVFLLFFFPAIMPAVYHRA
jgi:hypothetical protein